MKRKCQSRRLLLPIMLALIMIIPCGVISSRKPLPQPLPPSTMEVWGQAYLNETLLPDGKSITAWIDGTQYGDYITIAGGWYNLNIQGDWPETLDLKEGGVDDDLVIFEYIDGNDVYYSNITKDYVMNGWSVTPFDLYFNSSVEEPTELKINEICTDDGFGSQYVYLYNPSASPVNLSDYFLQKDIPGSTNGYDGATVALSGTIDAGGLSFVDLGAGGFLETVADELKLVWINTGTFIADGNDVPIDRVEYGNENQVPDDTILVDAPAPPSGWFIRRTPNGQDTDNCLADFQLYEIDLIPPEPATNVHAELTYSATDDVTIYWDLSADDGGGFNDVDHYEVWFITNGWHSTGDTYAWLDTAVIPSGTTSYVHVNRGADNGFSFCYQLRTYDTAGHETKTLIQAAKYAKSMGVAPNPSRWWLVGSAIVQSSTSIDHVVQGLNLPGEGLMAWDADNQKWLSNWTARPYSLNDLTDITNEMGFWLKIQPINTRLCTAGYIANMSIDSHTGWNLVPYPYAERDKNTDDIELDLIANCPNYVPGSLTIFDVNEPYRIRLPASDVISNNEEGLWIEVTADTVWTVINY